MWSYDEKKSSQHRGLGTNVPIFGERCSEIVTVREDRDSWQFLPCLLDFSNFPDGFHFGKDWKLSHTSHPTRTTESTWWTLDVKHLPISVPQNVDWIATAILLRDAANINLVFHLDSNFLQERRSEIISVLNYFIPGLIATRRWEIIYIPICIP